MPDILYLDSSALVKLVVEESETSSLTAALGWWRLHITSVVGEVELHRAAYREQDQAERADAVISRLSLLALDDSRCRLALRIGSRFLRTLDAIHLASAISLGADLGAFCCYDRRLIADAEAAGLDVVSPGLD